MFLSKILRKCSSIVLSVAVLSSVFVPAASVNAGMARGDKFLGNIIASNIQSNYDTYWNQVTPENGSKWESAEPSRDNMNWGNVDLIYNYCKKNKMPFKFHTLVWGNQAPKWIDSLSAADQKAEVLEWFQAAGQRYPDTEYIDVVNEPLHAPASFRNALGGSGSTGWDWIVWSFEQARKYFPNSKLLINDYGIISDPNAAANYVKIINILKSRGLVDGIGIQCHYFNMDTVSTGTMKNVLNTLGATGLPIYVSELDMTGNDSTQLARYKEKFPVLWESSYVKGITLWGWIQGQTWADNTHLMTSSGTERPALTWLKQYVASNSPTPTQNPTPTPTPTQNPTPTPTQNPSPTPTQSLTPTPTPITNSDIKVYFYNGNTAAASNTIYTNFKLVNTGTTDLNLSDVKMRYYFTNDGTQADSFACDYSNAGNSNVTNVFTNIVKTNADRYLEIGFSNSAGTLAAGASTEVRGRIWLSDWSNFTQTNDYSFNRTATDYTESTVVTGYVTGALKWGIEP